MKIVVGEIRIGQLQVVKQGRWCIKKRPSVPCALMELYTLTGVDFHQMHIRSTELLRVKLWSGYSQPPRLSIGRT